MNNRWELVLMAAVAGGDGWGGADTEGWGGGGSLEAPKWGCGAGGCSNGDGDDAGLDPNGGSGYGEGKGAVWPRSSQ